MYKAFLVEDEESIRARIRENFPWEENGYTLVGEAPDGELAVPLIRETEPDVLITDIMMPFIDGLELSRIVRKQMPWVKIIIVSGYDDFKYAQEALGIGVSEYILKPVKPADLSEVLGRIARILDDEKKRVLELERLEKATEESLSILKERFLLETVLYGKTPSEVIEKSYALDINLRANAYAIVIVRLKEHKEDENDHRYVEVLKLNALLEQVITEIDGVLLCPNTLEETILILTGEGEDSVTTFARSLSEEIERRCVELISSKTIFGVGKAYPRLKDLTKSYNGAKHALEYEFVFQDRTVFLEGDADHLASAGSEMPFSDQAKFAEFLKYTDRDGIEAFLDSYLGFLKNAPSAKPFFLRFAYLTGLMTTVRFIEGLSGSPEEILPETLNIDGEIASVKTGDVLRDKLSEVILRAVEFRSSRNFSRYSAQIDAAKLYIDENYRNPSLSLNDVASVANLSPSRFSTTFKQETGTKFIDYLTQVRMNGATELLKTSPIQVAEIANSVGYNDSHYFSYLFKKVLGITPTQFRNNIG